MLHTWRPIGLAALLAGTLAQPLHANESGYLQPPEPLLGVRSDPRSDLFALGKV